LLKKGSYHMPIIDIELITRKIKFINEDLKNLSLFKNCSLSDYLKDDLKKAAIERILEKIINRIIDINYHILKEEYETMPEDYYNSFIDLGKKMVIPPSFAKEIAESTGLRNALAHEYETIDDKKVYESIKIALVQVPKYLKLIVKFLKI